MAKKVYEVINKGETGKGLLIEHDGYISPECGNNKELFESYKKLNEEAISGEFHCPYPFIVNAVFQKADKQNANGRIYPRHILEREVEKYQKKIQEKSALGETNHPEGSSIDISRISINIIELQWVRNTVIGKLEIITSPGFRKHGIVSTCGDEVANLILQGYKLGVSSRALGSVTQRNGVLYVGDDLEILCWDVVSDPSTPEAYIFPDAIPETVIENTDNSSNSKLFEELKKFNNWLND